MKSNNLPVFRYSLMALSLSAGFSHADGNFGHNHTAELSEIKVSGTAVSTRTHRNQLDRETATDLKQVMKTKSIWMWTEPANLLKFSTTKAASNSIRH